MPSWKKVITSGSDAILNSLIVTGSVNVTGSVLSTRGGFTGSLLGTASYVTGSIHTSANPALSASYAFSGSYALTASYTLSSSYPFSVGSSVLSSSSDFTVIAIGQQAGFGVTNLTTPNANFIGVNAGSASNGSTNSNFIGYQAGINASAQNANFIGLNAGSIATNAQYSNFIGSSTGYSASNASYSTLMGYQVGSRPIASGIVNSIGRNNIIIGTNITLSQSRQDSINLGGIIFATGSYFSTTGNPFSGSVGNGRVGINITDPLYNLDVSGSGNYTNGLSVTGSTLLSGSLKITGSVSATQGGFTGSLFGTSSWALNVVGGSGVSDFPYTGSAIISGSLTIIQSGSFGLVITGSANTSSLIVSGGFTRILGSGSGIFTVTGSTGPILEISDINAATSKLLVFSSASTDVFSIYRNRTVEVSGSLSIVGANGPSASVSFTYLSGSTLASVTVYASGSSGPSSQSLYISGNLCPHPGRLTGTPASTSSFDLGQPGAVWRRLYVGRNSVYFVDEETDQTGSIGLDAAYGFTYNNFPIIDAQGVISSSYPFKTNGTTIYSSLDSNTANGASSAGGFFVKAGAGYQASNADNSNFIGTNAGQWAIFANASNFLGDGAGGYATNAQQSNFIGNNAGNSATYANSSNFFGFSAGYSATNAYQSNFFGYQSGYSASAVNDSNFLGYQAGYGAYSASYSNFLGLRAGSGSYGAIQSNFIGLDAGRLAPGANASNFIGAFAGENATNANYSNFIGLGAGLNAANASYSTFIGVSAGYDGQLNIGSNNIVIGNRITLAPNTSNYINIGGILFGSGSYFDNNTITSGSVGNGRIGINVVNPNYNLDVSGSGNYTNGLTVTGSLIAPNITGSNALFTGTITAQTLVVQTITSSTDYVTGSTRFGSLLTNTHQFTGSVSITGSLSLADGIASLTSSYSVSSSYAISSSRATNADNASAIDVSVFGSPVDSYVLISNVAGTTGVGVGADADFRYNASTNVLTVGTVSATSLTGSLLGTSSWSNRSVTASYVTGSVYNSANPALSASYALSSSYAVTASHAISSSNFVVSNTLVVDQTVTRFASSASSTAGSNIMFNLATGSYTSAFFKYVVTSGSNMRSGEVISGWSGSTATYTDFSTPDLGTTSAVTTSVAIASSQMQLNVTTNTSGWFIKTMATLM